MMQPGNLRVSFRNRIVRRDTVDPRQVKAHPQNWRLHPEAQVKALEGLLDEVGWVGEILWNERTGNLIDGHARIELAIGRDEAEVPRIVVDLSEEEERLVLATLDPLSAMAATNWEKLSELIENLPDLAKLWEQYNENENIRNHWKGMPQYTSEDQQGVQTIIVHFETREDVKSFAKITKHPITDKTKSMWYPRKEHLKEKNVTEYASES